MVKKFLSHIIVIVIVIAGLLACQNARPPVSAENLYGLMTHQNMIEFYEFPEAFKSIEGQHSGIIFANEKDTLQLVCSYPNLADEVNRYPFYVIKDNHENYWTLFQESGKYKIYRKDAQEATVKDAEESTVPIWIKSFCTCGITVVWMFMMFVIVYNVSAVTEKEKLSVNDIIKLGIFAFLIGGCWGLILV